jgi:quinoprotein glucose dehydrogenase
MLSMPFRIRRLIPAIALLSALLPAADDGIIVHKWSGDINVPDPVAVSVDPRGRVYVSSTTRRKVADLDIREHRDWIPADVGLDSVEAKRQFLHDNLAPGKTRLPRGGLADHNKDGSIDWRDLTVHTERIYQLRDTNGDGTADQITVFAEGFNTEVTGIAAGVLWHDGWVYATIAPDLWRLRDTNDDGVADEREVVAHGFGHHIAYAGHDMHGLALGPDGRIYWTIGDKGVNVTSREGRHFYYPHEGAVMRVEPDGSGFEVFASGLRNVQEIAFDAYGNWFGVDNDADFPQEKERVVAIIEGSDAGWRCAHQYMGVNSRWMRESIWQPAHTGQPLFILPPVALSRNGPAGFLWEPGTALAEPWRGKFFLSQFPSGQITALSIAADGPGFVLEQETPVSSGFMGIGMSWSPDGAIFIADWDGGYPLDEIGAVWRIDAAGADPELREQVRALLAGGLEKMEDAGLVTRLGHADQRVRLEAQLLLVKREAWAALQTVAADTAAPELARLHAVWGLGIGLRRGHHAVSAQSISALIPTATGPVKAGIATVLGDAPARAVRSAEALLPLLRDKYPPARVRAAIALGKLSHSSAVEPLFKLAREMGAHPVVRHATSFGLSGCADAAALSARATSSSTEQRTAALLALRRQASSQITAFLSDSDPRLVAEAARAIHDDTGIPDALPALAGLLDAGAPADLMTARRALNAACLLGSQKDQQRILAVALDPGAPSELRQEALRHLATWETPPALDPVDGTARRRQPRDPAPLARIVADSVPDLLDITDAEVRSAAIQMLVSLRVPVSAARMSVVIAEPAADDATRAAALELMAGQHPASPELSRILDLVWRDPSFGAKARAAALEILAQTNPPALVGHARRLLSESKQPLALKQTAIEKVAVLAPPHDKVARELLAEWLEKHAEGKLSADLVLDIKEAAARHSEGDERLAALLAQAAGTSPLPVELTRGGSRERGRDIVTNHLGANCLACHITEAKEGSNVGPPLRGIGKLQTREYILESLIAPGAVIAQGYGMVVLTLKSGESLAGTIAAEDKKTVTLAQPDGASRQVPLAEIAQRTPPISTMPPMTAILTPREIRDVVEYLASLTKP